MSPQIIQELLKYKTIIDMAKHINSQKAGGHTISHLLVDIQNLVNECQLTNHRTSQAPLVGAVNLFSQNLASHLYQLEIQRAESFFQTQLSAAIAAFSGQYQKTLTSQNEGAAKARLNHMGGKYMVDYVVLNNVVYLYNINPQTFSNMKEYLETL